MFSVYKHVNRKNGKVYIGITSKKPNKRWKNGKGYYQNEHFSSAIEKYGWDNFDHVIVAENCSKEEAERIEQELIKKYQSTNREFGYNNSVGGECPAYGAKWTHEMKERNSKAHKGKQLSSEHRANISKGKKGKPNGKRGLLGAQSGNAGLVLQIDEATKQITNTFFGYDEMHRKTGYAKTPVKEAARGIRKRAYGYLWEYRKVKGNVAV